MCLLAYYVHTSTWRSKRVMLPFEWFQSFTLLVKAKWFDYSLSQSHRHLVKVSNYKQIVRISYHIKSTCEMTWKSEHLHSMRWKLGAGITVKFFSCSFPLSPPSRSKVIFDGMDNSFPADRWNAVRDTHHSRPYQTVKDTSWSITWRGGETAPLTT